MPGRGLSKAITIKALLQHVSGTSPALVVSSTPSTTPGERQIVRQIAKLKPVGRPGQRWVYSNNGYYLLGRIVQRLTHQPYLRYLASNVVDTAWPGATATSVGCADRPGRGTALMYDATSTPPKQLRTFPQVDLFSAAGSVPPRPSCCPGSRRCVPAV